MFLLRSSRPTNSSHDVIGAIGGEGGGDGEADGGGDGEADGGGGDGEADGGGDGEVDGGGDGDADGGGGDGEADGGCEGSAANSKYTPSTGGLLKDS